MTDCIHEMPTETCSYCKEKKPYDGAIWDAKFAGPCAYCISNIEVGDSVRWSDDGITVVHARHGYGP